MSTKIYMIKVTKVITHYCEDDPYYDVSNIVTDTVGMFCSREAAEAVCSRLNKELGRMSYKVSEETIEDEVWTSSDIITEVIDSREGIVKYEDMPSSYDDCLYEEEEEGE